MVGGAAGVQSDWSGAYTGPVLVQKQIEIAADLETVWTYFWEVEQLAGCIPGFSEVRTIDPRRAYSAQMAQQVGPFRLRVPLQITVTRVEAPSLLEVQGSGRDAATASSLKGKLALRLESSEEGRTRLAIEADVNVLGKLGALGHSLILRKAHEGLEQFGACLRAHLEA
jgi:carbon monoxide dehydrogenase subunit G